MTKMDINTTLSIKKETLNALIELLQKRGYQTIGPKIKDHTLACLPIDSIEDLPYGYISEQEKGYYRLLEGKHKRYFDIVPGQQSWKQYLFPPRSELIKSQRQNGKWKETPLQGEPPKYAFIGVRPCDSAAICVQDRVFIRKDFTDPIYHERRQNLLIITVNCLHPAATCFCASMNTGPKADTGFDLSLTELDDVFVVEIGSDAGQDIMKNLKCEPASATQLKEMELGFTKAVDQMQRKIDNLQNVPQLLINNLDHSLWQEVGERCLSCTNCTLVCPTCFCWDTEDLTGLMDGVSQRDRIWDSCFNPSYTAQSFGAIHTSTKARYRQWLTHKMSTWKEQFGTLGCTGCGRCIVWCPAKIDITEEINKFQEALA